MKIIDLASWSRREHFEFFSTFDDPTFGIVSEVDCSNAYALVKEKQHSFFAWYMHKSMLAVDAVEEFKYRIADGQVVFYEEIHAGPTIGRKDGTFSFSFIPFDRDFTTFSQSLKDEIIQVQNSTGLRIGVDADHKNIVYYSTLPWIAFTGLKHPRDANETAGIPKITFGKMFIRDGKRMMPVSVHAHHGLLDGLHVGQYLDVFQELLEG